MNKTIILSLSVSLLAAIVVGSLYLSNNEGDNQDENKRDIEEGGSNIEEDVQNVNVSVVENIAEEKSVPHEVSLPAMFEKDFDGRDLKVGQVLAKTAKYTRYYIAYQSGDLAISGIMNVPVGTGPFPVLILNHGYIDPAVYTNGRGLKREQDYLASRGYVVIHPDYRNHAQSDKDPDNELNFRLGYTEDVINLVEAVQNSKLPYLDGERIGMLGHSMGGGVTQNVLVVKPDLVKAVVLFAPVSSDYTDNFEKWIRPDSQRRETAEKIIEMYGDPERNPGFWRNISSVNFFDRITAPIMIHHGTADESVPLGWSQESQGVLKTLGKTSELFVYEGEPHEFTAAWPTVMKRTVEFFDEYLKNN